MFGAPVSESPATSALSTVPLPGASNQGVLRREGVSVNTVGLVPLAMPTAQHPVIGVVLRGADVEMVGVHAGRVIALMQNVPSLGDRADVQDVGDAVRAGPPPEPSLVRPTERHHPVALGVAKSVPDPAPRGGVGAELALESLTHSQLHAPKYTLREP